MNHKIIFPSVHSMGGQPFIAEVSAPSEMLAIREVLEHCAREGIALEYVRIANVAGLEAARLDGLRLSFCKLANVNLCGASLVGSVFADTSFLKVLADSRTCFDTAKLNNVELDDCVFNGASFKAACLTALRFHFTEARALRLEDASINGLRSVHSDLTGWKAHLCRLKFVEAIESLIASMDLSENQKGAVRTLAVTGSREAALHHLRSLEAQTV
jgi:uncharacterized protein YjbI with pentapeptide repeats